MTCTARPTPRRRCGGRADEHQDARAANCGASTGAPSPASRGRAHPRQQPEADPRADLPARPRPVPMRALQGNRRCAAGKHRRPRCALVGWRQGRRQQPQQHQPGVPRRQEQARGCMPGAWLLRAVDWVTGWGYRIFTAVRAVNHASSLSDVKSPDSNGNQMAGVKGRSGGLSILFNQEINRLT